MPKTEVTLLKAGRRSFAPETEEIRPGTPAAHARDLGVSPAVFAGMKIFAGWKSGAGDRSNGIEITADEFRSVLEAFSSKRATGDSRSFRELVPEAPAARAAAPVRRARREEAPASSPADARTPEDTKGGN